MNFIKINNLIYKTKNKIYSYSKEAKKLKRPKYNDLLEYQNFKKDNYNKFAISFGAGRCGQNWFSKIFNSHSNWIGTCERFADYESFYRYISYYNLPVHREEFFNLLELASKRDMSLYQNSLISSPYLSFGVEELSNRLNPDYIFFNIRSPIKNIESLYRKGWYFNYDDKIIKSPSIDISGHQYRSFSRIIPSSEYLNDWFNLTRIGKITWFWCTINKAIYNSFTKIQKTKKYYIKLEDIDQNYESYLKLSENFKFKNLMTKKEFYNVVNKAENKEFHYKYEYKNWNDQEKKEFEKITNNLFPYYDEIKTNI